LPHWTHPNSAPIARSISASRILIATGNHRHLFHATAAIRHILNIFSLLRIFFLLSQSSSPALAAAPTPDQIRAVAGEVTKDLQVQSRLPNDSGATEFPLDRRPGGLPFGFGGNGIYIPGGEAIVGLMQWAFMIVAVIAIFAVLAILLREPLQSRFQPALSPPLPLAADAAPPADPRELLGRADRLASEGLFAEAMHCVLLAAMILLGGPDSRTSWELLRSAALPASQLSALRDLVMRVERAWFGQRPAGPDDYDHVRGIFDDLHSPRAASA
jgi:hypothetical protein